MPILLVLGYWMWDRHQTSQQAAEDERLARVTARVWVGTAIYRNDSERYLVYRDSVLEANNVPLEQIVSLMDHRSEESETTLLFIQRVRFLVDSLSRVEDSILRAEKIRLADSVRTSGDSNTAAAN